MQNLVGRAAITAFTFSVVFGLTPFPAHAGANTHLGQKASQMVTAAFSANGGTPCPNNKPGFVVDTQVTPDGGASPFGVPDRMVLIIMDMEWDATTTPNSGFAEQLLIGTGTPNLAAISTAMSDSNGAVGASEPLQRRNRRQVW